MWGLQKLILSKVGSNCNRILILIIHMEKPRICMVAEMAIFFNHLSPTSSRVTTWIFQLSSPMSHWCLEFQTIQPTKWLISRINSTKTINFQRAYSTTLRMLLAGTITIFKWMLAETQKSFNQIIWAASRAVQGAWKISGSRPHFCRIHSNRSKVGLRFSTCPHLTLRGTTLTVAWWRWTYFQIPCLSFQHPRWCC